MRQSIEADRRGRFGAYRIVMASSPVNTVPSSSPASNNNPRRKNKHRKSRSPKQMIRQQFKKAKVLERQGQWRKAIDLLDNILQTDPTDAYSHLALAKLEARRNNATAARACFQRGTDICPESVHLWQAWAVHEEQRGNLDEARRLYERALLIDQQNPYVCHAYGLMEYRLSNKDAARQLWEQALQKSSTAALVCSLGHLLTELQQYEQARGLYVEHVLQLESEREKTEVYLASAWLEERHFSNYGRAEELLKIALVLNPKSSLAQVALARLEGRSRQRLQGEEVRTATRRRLANACITLEQGNATSQPEDGRVYNAWANLEVKARRFDAARKILRRGLERYPKDYSLLQAAGRVEERVGNYSGARILYSTSLCVEPSAPTLVGYAMLEMRHPESGVMNFTMVERLFEEALLIDPRHGPAYNSYGSSLLQRGMVVEARKVFERGVRANCTDAASVYHGYAKVELSLGNVKRAKLLLKRGLSEARRQEIGTDSPHRERASFLTHTLGMLELNSEEPSKALVVFTDGIHRYGNSSQLLLGSALCEAKLGNEEKARALFEKSVLVDEKHAQAWQAWGVMEMRAGNWNSSRTLFQCGIKSVPRHGALWQGYATLEGRLGNIEAARALFVNGIRRASKHVPLYQAWASLELKQGNFTHAKALITEALTRDKRNGSGWIIAADIERKMGNAGLVNLILRRGIECAPTHVELYRALGDGLISSGKINEARQVFEKGIEIDPLYGPLYHSLAELEARVFNVEGLSRLNKQASAIFKTNALANSFSTGEEAWGRKIRAGRSRIVPKGVVALAQRIVDDENETDPTAIDPGSLEDILNTNLLDGGLIGQLLDEETEGSIQIE
jgi:tetratricopeptide (TPR) repeat protein